MVVVRIAEERDYKNIYLLNRLWHHEGISPFSFDPPYDEYLEILKNSTTLVAEKDGEIVGFLICKGLVAEHDSYIHGFKKGDRYANIDSLYVVKKDRGKGIGTKLLNECMAILKKAGYKKVIVSADSREIDKLVKFYKDNGFEMLFVRLMREL